MNGDLDWGLIGEDRKCFHVCRSKGSSNPSKAKILYNLQLVDEKLFWVIWIKP